MRCSMGLFRVSTAVLALAFLVSGSILPRDTQRLALVHPRLFDKSRRDNLLLQVDQLRYDQSETPEGNYDRRSSKDYGSSLKLLASEKDDELERQLFEDDLTDQRELIDLDIEHDSSLAADEPFTDELLHHVNGAIQSRSPGLEIDNYSDDNAVLVTRGSSSPPPPPSSKRKRLSASPPHARADAPNLQRSNNAQRGHSPPSRNHTPDAQSIHPSNLDRSRTSSPSQFPHIPSPHDSRASTPGIRRSPSSFSSNRDHAKTNNGAQAASVTKPVISGYSRSPGISRQQSLDQSSHSPILSNPRNSNPAIQHGGRISPAGAITRQSSVSRSTERRVSFSLPGSPSAHESVPMPMETSQRTNNHVTPSGMTPDGRTVHSRLYHADQNPVHSNSVIQAQHDSPFSNNYEHTNGIRRRSVPASRTILEKKFHPVQQSSSASQNKSPSPHSSIKPSLEPIIVDFKSNSDVTAIEDGRRSSSFMNSISPRSENQNHSHTHQKRAVLLPRTPMRSGQDSHSPSRVSSLSGHEHPPWQYSGDRSSMGSISAPVSRATSPQQPERLATGSQHGRSQLRPDIPGLIRQFNEHQHAIPAQRPPLHQRQRAPALQFFVDLANSHGPDARSPTISDERPQSPLAHHGQYSETHPLLNPLTMTAEHPQQEQMPQLYRLRTQSAGRLQGNAPATQSNSPQRDRNAGLPGPRRNPPRQAAVPARFGGAGHLSSSSDSPQVVPSAGAPQVVPDAGPPQRSVSGPRVYLRGQSPGSSQSTGSVGQQLRQPQQPQQPQERQQPQQPRRNWSSPPSTPRQSSPPRENRRRRGPYR